MPVIEKPPRTLDARGLRQRCDEGHRIYWIVRKGHEDTDFARWGSNQNYGCTGVCTAGDYWEQSRAMGSGAVSGVLQRGAVPPEVRGQGIIEWTWRVGVRPESHPSNGYREADERHPMEGVVHVECRAGHSLVDGEGKPLGLPRPTKRDDALSFRDRLLQCLQRAGWLYADGRLECPEHLKQRILIEDEVARLRTEDRLASGKAVRL